MDRGIVEAPACPFMRVLAFDRVRGGHGQLFLPVKEPVDPIFIGKNLFCSEVHSSADKPLFVIRYLKTSLLKGLPHFLP